MKFFSGALSLLIAGFAVAVCCASAAAGDFSPSLDPAFSEGFATLKQVTRFIETPESPPDWKPNLQLLVGVKAVEGTKRTTCFVQLTTLAPTTTNSEPWQPILRTNEWAWSATNKAQFVTALYPVRVRVYDEFGRQIKEGQTPMAWGMTTNGLMDMCRLAFEEYHRNTETNATRTRLDGHPVPAGTGEGPGEGDDSSKPRTNDELARATGGGFLWMISMLYDLQTVRAVAQVWAKAQCAIRWPSAWTMATSLVKGLSLSIEPRLKDVTLANTATSGDTEPLYRLPVDLKSGKRKLTRVEIVVGPAHGAEMLLAGIRSVRAAHPTKPKQEFLAQVLAVGTSEEK